MKLIKRLIPDSIVSKISRIPAKLLGLLPISSEVIGAPKGFYASTKTWATVRGDRASLKPSYSEIYPGESVRLVEPKTIDSEIHWRYQVGRQYQSLPAFVATVPYGRLWGQNAVITPDDKLLADVSIGFKVDPNNPKHHPIYQQWKLPRQKQLAGTTAVLSVAGGNTFAHWLLDVLPRLDLVRQACSLADIDQFVLNGVNQPFQRETLAMLGIPLERVIPSSETFHAKCDRLIVPSLSRRTVELSKWIPRWACEFLRREFLQPEMMQAESSCKRIYISRASAKRRKLLNESEVLAHLISLGFQNVILEKLTILEQIQLFASAEVVVAPHGAGLAHLVFSHPGTKLIELLSPNYVNINFWALSNQVNLDYYYLLGEGDRPTAQTYRHLNGDDILVDLQKFKATLALAGVES